MYSRARGVRDGRHLQHRTTTQTKTHRSSSRPNVYLDQSLRFAQSLSRRVETRVHPLARHLSPTDASPTVGERKYINCPSLRSALHRTHRHPSKSRYHPKQDVLQGRFHRHPRRRGALCQRDLDRLVHPRLLCGRCLCCGLLVLVRVSSRPAQFIVLLIHLVLPCSADLECVCTNLSFQAAALACLEATCTAADVTSAQELQTLECATSTSSRLLSHSSPLNIVFPTVGL